RLPEADVALLVDETTDKSLAAAGRRDRIGQGERGAANLLVGDEAFFAAKVTQTWLKRRRVCECKIAVRAQRLQASRHGQTIRGNIGLGTIKRHRPHVQVSTHAGELPRAWSISYHPDE